MIPKKTDWFPPGINPVHLGRYETSSNPDRYHLTGDVWDGIQWSDRSGRKYLVGAGLFWRGLTEKEK